VLKEPQEIQVTQVLKEPQELQGQEVQQALKEDKVLKEQ
jgi:hypothetical protein